MRRSIGEEAGSDMTMKMIIDIVWARSTGSTARGSPRLPGSLSADGESWGIC